MKNLPRKSIVAEVEDLKVDGRCKGIYFLWAEEGLWYDASDLVVRKIDLLRWRVAHGEVHHGGRKHSSDLVVLEVDHL